MKDRLYTILAGVAAVVVSVLASVFAVDNISERTVEQAMDLGKVQSEILVQKQTLKRAEIELAEQQTSLRNVADQIHDLTQQATGLAQDEDARGRLDKLKALSDTIASSPNLDRLLLLESRIDALTNPDRMDCTIVPVTYGPSKSCGQHPDWIPQASCPAGKSIRSIDIVAKNLSGGWGCGFQLECCSNLGAP